jgi:hypothetical protein
LHLYQANLTLAFQAFSAKLILKHFGSIRVEELKWKPSGCEIAILESFVMQVAPYVAPGTWRGFQHMEFNIQQVAAFHALGCCKNSFA